jgi:Spy/CpxP family protein refolding chaperone
VELKTNNNQLKIMKSTKTMLMAALAAGALIACSPSMLAQDSTNTPPAGAPAGSPPGGGMRRGGPSLEQLTKILTLTDDQKPQVKAALDERMQKMKDLRNDPGFADLSREDKMAKVKPIMDAFVAKMKDILTPDQFAKFQKMGQGMRGNRPPGSAPATTPPAATNPPQA